MTDGITGLIPMVIGTGLALFALEEVGRMSSGSGSLFGTSSGTSGTSTGFGGMGLMGDVIGLGLLSGMAKNLGEVV